MKSEAKLKRKTRKQCQLLNESGFVPCVAPPSLSRDLKIKKMKISTPSRDLDLTSIESAVWKKLGLYTVIISSEIFLRGLK